MEIIKQGKLRPIAKEDGIEITCGACESVIKYFPDEVKIHPNESGRVFYIVCPVCANAITILTLYSD